MQGLEWDIISEIVFGGIFEAFEEEIVVGAIEIDTLVPSHLAQAGIISQCLLGMHLIAPGLLALPRVGEKVDLQISMVHLVRSPELVLAPEVVDGPVEHGMVIIEDCDARHRVHHGRVIVAVIAGLEILDHLIKDQEHLFAAFLVFLGPSGTNAVGLVIGQNFRGIGKMTAVPAAGNLRFLRLYVRMRVTDDLEG